MFFLMMALGLGAECFALSNRATAADTFRQGRGVLPVYENGSKAQTVAMAEKSHSDEKKLSRAGPINEDEAKRLRLIFLLMMSLGKYRT